MANHLVKQHKLTQLSIHFVWKAVFLCIYIFIEYFLFTIFVLPYYHSQFAVTVREDLKYVSSQMAEDGYGESLSCEPIYKWPYTKTLLYLTNYTDLLANQYVVKGLSSLQNTKIITYPKDDKTPDILERIEIPELNDKTLEPVFTNIQYNMAVVSESSRYQEAILKEWLEGKQKRLDEAAVAYQKAENQYKFHLAFYGACLLAPIIGSFFLQKIYFHFAKKKSS